MKATVARIVPVLALAAASGCGGSPAEQRGDATKSGAGAAAPVQGAIQSTTAQDSRIPVSAKSRGGRDSGTSDRERRRSESAALLGLDVGAIDRRANRSTALLEVSIGEGPNRVMRTGAAFCVDAAGLFVTHGDVVRGVTEKQGQVRMLFGDGLEPRTAAYPRIVRIDDEANLASLRIDPAPGLSLEALAPAGSAELAPGATVVVFAFPWGRHYVEHDAKGKLVEGPKFDFTYFHPWGKEPPDHLIRPLKVQNVWRENGRPGSFDFDQGAGGGFSDLCSGSPALNAAGEVIGILIRPDPRAKETIIVQSSGQGVVVGSDAPAPFMGALAVEHLSRFLADAGHPGGPAAAAAEAGHFEMIRKGKAATALVEVSTRAGECSGTAFCVDRSGLFVTNAHVIEDTTGDPRHVVNLVLDSGLPTQRTQRATVVRIDAKVDLALLKTEGDAPPEAIELGSDGEAAPTMRVTTFGFPLGKDISGASRAAEGSYPQVAVNTSRITALGEAVRFDGKLNPGNSGGPVLDPRGRVIGVARAGMQFAAINFAIPVGRLREFLATPGLEVRMLPVAFADRARPTTWAIRVIASRFAGLPADLAVAVTVGDGANQPRRLWAEPDPAAGPGTFRLEFVPRPRDPGRPVSLVLRTGGRIVRAAVEDQPVTIGGQAVRLAAIRHLVLRPRPWAYVTDEPAAKGPPFVGPGRVVRGPITGLGEVMAVQDNSRKAIDLGAAAEFSVVAVETVPAPEVGAVIEVHKGGKGGPVLCGTSARLPFQEAEAVATPSNEPPARTRPATSQAERTITLVTRTMARGPRTVRLRLNDKESLFRIGGDLDVAGGPRGAGKAIRPPRASIGKALAESASEAGVGTRMLDIPAPPGNAVRRMDMQPDRFAGILGVGFSPDGSLIALGLQESIRVHDVSSGRLVKELAQPQATHLAFSANNARLIAYSASYPDTRNIARPASVRAIGPVWWDLKTGTTASPASITQIERGVPVEWISADGRFIAAFSIGFQCWDLRSGAEAMKLDTNGRVGTPSPTPDGTRLVSLYSPNGSSPARTVRVHEIATGRLLAEMDLAGMTLVGLLPGTLTCVCEAADGAIVVRDLKAGKELRRVTPRPTTATSTPLPSGDLKPPPPAASQLTADGKRLVKPMIGGGFALLDLASGAEIARYKPRETGAAGWNDNLVLAPSGRVAAIYSGRDVYLWTLAGRSPRQPEVAARKPEVPLVRELPGPATAVSVGGAGRYLLLTLGGARQLVVFDLNAAEIVKTVPLATGKALVAAGANKFVIADPEARLIERWDLGTLAREGKPQPLPFDGAPEAIVLGADSEGPLLAAWRPSPDDGRAGRFSFIDLATLRVLAVPAIALQGGGEAGLAASGGDFAVARGGRPSRTVLRASFDGSVFTIGLAGNSHAEWAVKAEAGVLTLSQDMGVPVAFGTALYMIPSSDGRRVIDGRTGVREAVFLETPFGARARLMPEEQRLLRFPTTDPRLDISLRAADAITVLRAGDGTRFLTVVGLGEMAGVLQKGDIVRDGISLENRYHLVPAAKLLVTIPPTNDRLVLRRLDIPPAAGR